MLQIDWAHDVPLLHENALRAAQGDSLAAQVHCPIGVFDSGLGGLSVLRHLQTQMPNEAFIYLADNAHVPYGDKSEAWIRERMERVTQWFLAQGCKAIVWACNTATAAGATHMRERYPDVFFVGLEPAIKPAMMLTRTQCIAMLATQRTVDSAKYAALVARTVPESVQLQSIACVGWAQAIDAGQCHGASWDALLAQYLEPVRAFGADVVVLGCTHYPFIGGDIQAYLGANVLLLDSGAPVARYTQRVLSIRHGLNSSAQTGSVRYCATLLNESVRTRWAFFMQEAAAHTLITDVAQDLL